MARVSALTPPQYQPDFFAEAIGAGTHALIPGGLPIDVSTVPIINGNRTLLAGSIVNRLFPTDPTLPPVPYKYWTNASTEALEDFYLVAFTLEKLMGTDGTATTDPGCVGIRDKIMIYEDRLPNYWAALTTAKKNIIRQKYIMLTSSKVAI